MDCEVMRQVAWIGDDLLEDKARAVVLVFHGLGIQPPKKGPSTEEIEWARQGGLVVFPYCGPWTWTNRLTRGFVNELLDAVYREFGLTENAPIISTGGSMGGQSALLYARYSRRPIAACHALYPVCDLKYHFNERADLPATMRFAFRGYTEEWNAVMEEHSPLHQVENMPKIPYLIIHGDADTAVSKKHHSDPFVAQMMARGHDVEYAEVTGMDHGGPMPLDVLQQRIGFVSRFLGS